MKYFTFIGNHDFIEPSREGFGAALTIFFNYKDDLDGVYIFASQDKPGRPYMEMAKKTMRRMLQEKKELPVTIIEIGLDNPVNFDLVYKVMLDETKKVIESDNIVDDEKIINITSGTPTMSTCWVLLQKSGLISNAILVQSFEKQFQRKYGKACQEVNLEIEDFPEIKSTNAIKRELDRTKAEVKVLKDEKSVKDIDDTFPNIVGSSTSVRQLKEQILKLIDSQTHVLILGEPGTGKEVVARAIWQEHRKEIDKDLNVFDCGTFSEELILSELFGHEKGAFTGAINNKKGIVEQCNGKILYLDEIGNIPRDKQAVLMRFLQFGDWKKVGSDRVNKSDIQIIAATNKNINDVNIFAPDLRDRFDEIVLLPPLRERKDDIKQLVDHFLLKTGNSVSFEKDIYAELMAYSWPGNIRQLEKWVQRICRFYKDAHIQWADIEDQLRPDLPSSYDDELMYPEFPIDYYDYTDQLRERALESAGGNQSKAANLLSIKATTMRQWVLKQRKQNR